MFSRKVEYTTTRQQRNNVPLSPKDEALDALRKNGAELVAFVGGLSNDELDRKGSMPAFGGEVTVNQVLEFVIFQSAQEHFDSMKTAVGK